MQKRAARFVTRNYSYETGSMTGILEELKWETLQKRRKDNRLILMYKGLKGKARIPTDDLIPKNRRCRKQHSLVFQIPSASKDSYMKSFFPQTIRDWNALPDSLISSSELSDDCVSKFTSLREFHNKVPPEKVSLLCRKFCVINKPFIENIVYFCLQDIWLPEKMIYDKHIHVRFSRLANIASKSSHFFALCCNIENMHFFIGKKLQKYR